MAAVTSLPLRSYVVLMLARRGVAHRHLGIWRGCGRIVRPDLPASCRSNFKRRGERLDEGSVVVYQTGRVHIQIRGDDPNGKTE